jgi:hypothetical protein
MSSHGRVLRMGSTRLGRLIRGFAWGERDGRVPATYGDAGHLLGANFLPGLLFMVDFGLRIGDSGLVCKRRDHRVLRVCKRRTQ